MEPTGGFDHKRAPGADRAPPPQAGLGGDVRSLWHELNGLVHDQFELAAPETRQARESLVSMLVAGVLVAGMLLSAWLGLIVVAVLWLINAGIGPSIAVLVAVAANLALALVLSERIRSRSRRLQSLRTVRALRSAPAGDKRSES